MAFLFVFGLMSVNFQAYPGPYPPGGSCNFNGPQQICLAAPSSSNVVLQREPAAAAITGSVPERYGKPGQMVVTVSLIDETKAYMEGFAAPATSLRQLQPYCSVHSGGRDSVFFWVKMLYE